MIFSLTLRFDWETITLSHAGEAGKAGKSARGFAGCVALFEIECRSTVNILAVRHQREEDYQ